MVWWHSHFRLCHFYFSMKDNVIKNSKWEFDQEVADVFSDMISRSIPDYQHMRTTTFLIGRNFLPENGYFVDLGCSNGLSSIDFVKNINANYLLLDVSEPMIEKSKEMYKDNKNVSVLLCDFRNSLPFENVDLVLSSLTLQFTPIEYRHSIIRQVWEKLKPGGAFIMIEKILGSNSTIDKILVDSYYDIKRMNGYTNEQIFSKKKSLEGSLVPLTADFNEWMLRSNGFSHIEPFWRCLNFSAWLAIK